MNNHFKHHVHSLSVWLQVRSSTVSVQEGGVQLELTVVDTPGFGDVVDNTDWWVVCGVWVVCVVCGGGSQEYSRIKLQE